MLHRAYQIKTPVWFIRGIQAGVSYNILIYVVIKPIGLFDQNALLRYSQILKLENERHLKCSDI